MHIFSGFWRIKLGAILAIMLGGRMPYAQSQTLTNQFYQTSEGLTLSAVLTNVAGAGELARLVKGPSNGQLVLDSTGLFTYTPTNNFTGMDGFLYRTSVGSQGSADIMVLAPDQMFHDNFSRPTNDGAIFPWEQYDDGGYILGSWGITNGLMLGHSPPTSYALAYYQNTNWVDYTLQAQVRFSATNAASAAISGRLSPGGGHYSAWLYPEGSTEDFSPHNGTAVMQLLKYEDWTNWMYIGGTITLPGIGTNWHTLTLSFVYHSFFVFFDGTFVTNVTDNWQYDALPPFTSGGITLNMWTLPGYAYTYSVRDVTVSTNCFTGNVAFNTPYNTPLQVPTRGLLADSVSYGTANLFPLLVQGPAHGSVVLTNNGGFSYTPAPNFLGNDAFTYQATDGVTTSAVATVSITVGVPPPTILSSRLGNNSFTITWSATPGAVYAIQSTAGLFNPQWSNVVTNVVAGGYTASQVTPALVAPVQFYRVVRLTP